MEPILSKIEKKNPPVSTARFNPIDDLTSVDRVPKSRLVQADIITSIGTKRTFVERETTDDD